MYSLIQKLSICLFAVIVTITATAQTSQKNKFSTSNIYAGIEVGSKGVKMSIIEMNRKTQANGAFNILKDTSVNTDFITFDQKTFDATVAAFAGLFTSAVMDYKIASKRIFTVISSGVKGQAEKDKKTEWITKLIAEFRTKVKEPGRVVEVVDVMQEAKLSHLGIVPESRRYKTFLIDIGSGNTKGGFFPYGTPDNFYLFQIGWGTKSTANATEKLCDTDKSLGNFVKQLPRVVTGAENTEIIYAVNSSGSYPLSDYIAFSGGIAWSVATLIYPELNNSSIVPVTYEDVETFYKKLNNNYPALKDDILLSKLDESKWDKAGITHEVKRVHQVFDQKSLLSGTALLLKIMRQFKSSVETKQFYLVKNGQVGWVSAYVDKMIE
jgi:Tfp pilus assembly protein PilV